MSVARGSLCATRQPFSQTFGTPSQARGAGGGQEEGPRRAAPRPGTVGTARRTRSPCRAEAPGAEGAGPESRERVRVHAAPAPAPGLRMPGRRPWQRDMQPARKLLSLLFLILMGTELTQVRASNAILLPASERGGCAVAAQPGAGTGTWKSGAARSSARRQPPAGVGRGPACLPRSRSGGREGRGLPQDCCASPPGTPALARPCGAEPSLLGPPASRSPEKFKGQHRGSFAACHPGGLGEQGVQAPGISRGRSESHPPHPCPEHPASLPLGMMPPLGLPKQAAVAIVPRRPDGEGQAARAGLGALWTQCAGLGGCGHMRRVKCEWQAAVCVCGDRWAF